MKDILRVSNLNFSYDNYSHVLRNVNFSIKQGDFIAITGSNGVGKTTLLKLLLGELNCSQGEISWFGRNIKYFKDWSHIGYVAQHNILSGNLFPANVLEVVRSSLYARVGLFKFYKNIHNLRSREILDLVGMGNYADRIINELSGGQQQKVMLAKALVSEPRIIILDEPVSGVDIKSSKEVYDILHNMNKEKGLAVLIITHELDKFSKYLNNVFNIDAGILNNAFMRNDVNWTVPGYDCISV